MYVVGGSLDTVEVDFNNTTTKKKCKNHKYESNK